MTVRLDTVMDEIDNLPALPGITVRIIQVMADPRADINHLLEIVQYDQSLTGQVLRLCNSAYFGLSRKIGTLKEALAYLGSKHLMQIVLGVHCSGLLQKAQPGYGLVVGMLWRHSATVALIAERTGKQINFNNPGMLFTAGLLHDIGKVILGSFLADSYQQVISLLSHSPITFPAAEKEVLGFSHAEVGEALTSRWHLPKPLVAAARYHHEPDSYDGTDPLIRQTIDLVHIADSLALTMGLGIGDDGLMYNIDPTLARKYAIADRQFELVEADVLIELERMETIYNGGK